MENLNEKQQAIIDNLIGEFKKLNEPISKGSLIDVGEIKKEYDDQKNRKIEIERSTQQLKELIIQVGQKDCEILNKDLKDLGLVAKFPNSYFIRITDDAGGYVCHSKELTIYIQKKQTHSERLLDVMVDVYEGYRYTFNNKSFSSLEKLVNDSFFKSNLKTLFYEAKKINKGNF